MVGCALDARARLGEAHDGARELLARVEQQGEVVEAGVAAAGRGAGLLDEHEEVLAAGAERGACRRRGGAPAGRATRS